MSYSGYSGGGDIGGSNNLHGTLLQIKNMVFFTMTKQDIPLLAMVDTITNNGLY